MNNDYLNNKKFYYLSKNRDRNIRAHPIINNKKKLTKVNINTLLNRVKINEVKKRKENFILFFVSISVVSIATIFIFL
jgi:hypothetical protein